MAQAEDMMLNGRGARLMRGACALGVLALVAVALSACAPSPEREARIAEQKRLEAINAARMDLALSTMVKHCPAILSKEGIEPFLARMEAKAAALGPEVSPPLEVSDGILIDSALYEDAPTPGVALRVRIHDPFAKERARTADPAMGREDTLPEPELHDTCGADIILFDGGSGGIQNDIATLWSHATEVADDVARAVGGQASSTGSSTFQLPASVKTGSRDYSIMLVKLAATRGAVPPALFHTGPNPVQDDDTITYYRLYQTGAYISSTQR